LIKFKINLNQTSITGTSHEDRHIFMILSRSFLLRMRNVSDKICTENENTPYMYNNFFFFRKSCCLWDKAGKFDRVGQTIDDNMAHEHGILDN